MTDEKRRPRPAAQYGPTAEVVAANVARLRKARGLTIYGLSGLLEKAGRPITPSAIAKVEKQQRQVTVDDLAALAVAFGVSPAALLLPLDDDPNHRVEVTGAGQVPASSAWAWASGRQPLKLTPGREEAELLEHQLNGLPSSQVRMRQQPLWRALQVAEESTGRLLRKSSVFVEGDDEHFADQVHQARRALERVAAELDHLESTRAGEAADLKRWAEDAKKPKGEDSDGPSVD